MRVYKNLPLKIQRRVIYAQNIYTVESRKNKNIVYALAPDEIAIISGDAAVRCDIAVATKELEKANLRREVLEELKEVITDYKEVLRYGCTF